MSDPDIQALLDERAIREVLTRYCRGVDRLDAALIASCYHPDSTDDHGMYKGAGVDFGEFCVKALRVHAAATQHVLGQSRIELDGDSAHCETYVVAHHRCERGDDTVLETFGGRYVDRMDRRGGDWKISHRLVICEWEKRETVDAAFPPDTFQAGIRSLEDPAYGFASDC